MLPDSARAADADTSTRVFALLGDPVSHSLSPSIQNAAFAAERLDARYVTRCCAADEVPALMRALARAGGGGNVTVPHKQVAAAALDRPRSAVLRTGASNTFWLENGRLVGDNTDVEGFDRALRAFLGDPRDADVLLLGAGGAAAAALHALLEGGADRITVVNRTMPRAEKLVARVAGPGEIRAQVATGLAALRETRFDIAVNATSLGLRSDDDLPAGLDDVPFAAVFDMVYAPGGTRWVRAARARGLAAIDGHEMLLHQAAAAFERWWSLEAPVEAMRAALERT